MAGCVLAVSLSSSSEPSKHILEIEKPNALSASSKTARAAGYFSASSLPMPEYCDACPGNTNATLPIAASFSRTSGGNQGGRELLFDLFVHARAGESRSHANRVFHGVGVRTAVANHADASDTQQRRAAVLRVINRLSQRLEGAFRKHRAHLREDGSVQRLFQQTENLKRQAFANLQRDIPHESVADNDVHLSRKKIAAFDISYEMHGAFLQAGEHFARQLVALDLFFTDGEQ